MAICLLLNLIKFCSQTVMEDGAIWGGALLCKFTITMTCSVMWLEQFRPYRCKTPLHVLKLIGDSQMVQHAFLCIADTDGMIDCVNCTTRNSVTKRL